MIAGLQTHEEDLAGAFGEEFGGVKGVCWEVNQGIELPAKDMWNVCRRKIIRLNNLASMFILAIGAWASVPKRRYLSAPEGSRSPVTPVTYLIS